MARSVYDVAAMLGALVGVDPADPATAASEGQTLADYTAVLDATALEGARIGVARQFMGGDAEVDWIVDAALETMREGGATIVDVTLPEWLIAVKGSWYTTIRWREFRQQIPDYLAALGPEYPKSLADLVDRSHDIVSRTDAGGTPNPVRWRLFEDEEASGSTDDYEYRAMHEHGLALVRDLVNGVLADHELDAIVYPTSPSRPARIDGEGPVSEVPSATNLANLTGFPDLIVPAGFTTDGLPVGISFLGPAFSEARLLGLGYAFESRAPARRDPVTTPPLPGEVIPR